MTAHLVPCPSCSRHVRASENTCPFCNEGVPAELRDAPPPRAPGRRLRRAALCVASAGTLTLTSACSTGAVYGGPPVTDAGSDADAAQMMALYGGPPPQDAGTDLQPAALYGAPPLPPDSSAD